MKLTPAQSLVSSDPARFRVVSAGRRFGKSMLSLNEMAKYARFPNRKILYIAPTYRQAKTVIWDELQDQLIERRWVKKINQSELQITLVNNSTITIRSAETRDALRGGKYHFIVMDECADIEPEVWYQILRPTLSDTLGDALFIGSPKGRNWFYDIWLQGGDLEGWSSHQFTTLQGGNVPESEIIAARRDMSEREFNQEYLAQFVTYSGVIFYAYGDHNVINHDKQFLSEYEPVHIGIDFNVTPLCAVVATLRRGIIHIFDEIEIHGSNTAELVDEIRTRYPNRPVIAYPDATGKRTNTNSGGLSDHLILQSAGFQLQVAKANPPVADTIHAVNACLEILPGQDEPRLQIHPECRRIRNTMIKYTYKPDTRVPDKNAGWDHLADAIRYLVNGIHPHHSQHKKSVAKKSYRRA